MVASFNYDVKDCMRELYPENRWGLLTILMLFANAGRRCWPSIDGLAHLMHTSQRKVIKARDWLIEHKALEIVPYDKRVGDELKQPARQLIYQLTGNVVIDGKSFAYLYADVSGGGNIKSRGKAKVSDGDVSAVGVSDGGNGTKNQIPNEVKPIEESQSVSLRSTDCARDPQPEPTMDDYTAALAKHGVEPGAVVTQGDKVLGTLGNPDPPKESSAKEKVPPFSGLAVPKSGPPIPIEAETAGELIQKAKDALGIPTPSWNLVNLDTGEIVETFTNPIAAKSRCKELNLIGGAKYVTRIVKPDRPPPKPWSALTTAMHEAIPAAIRPPRCHYGKNDKAARALHDAGFTAQEVSEFVLWSYDYDPWLMSGGTGGAAIPATMYYVETHIKPWKAKHNGPSSHNSDRFAPPPGVRFARPAP